MRFDAQEGVDPRDDADGLAPQLVVLEGQIAGAGRRRPGRRAAISACWSRSFLSKLRTSTRTVPTPAATFRARVRRAMRGATGSRGRSRTVLLDAEPLEVDDPHFIVMDPRAKRVSFERDEQGVFVYFG